MWQLCMFVNQVECGWNRQQPIKIQFLQPVFPIKFAEVSPSLPINKNQFTEPTLTSQQEKMAGTKGIMLFFSIALAAFHLTSSETLTYEKELTLQSMLSSSGLQMDPAKDWKNHPLFPLYPIDFPVCKDAEREKKYGLCKEWESKGYCTARKTMMKKYCPLTCGMCKALAAAACYDSPFGCCWDNSIPFGPNKEGCPPCLDLYPTTCPQFKNYCSRQGRNARFIRYHCFDTCGRCAAH